MFRQRADPFMLGSVLLTWFAPYAAACTKRNAVGIAIGLVVLLLAPLLLNDLLVRVRAQEPDADVAAQFRAAIAPQTVDRIVAMRGLNLPTTILTTSGQVVLVPAIAPTDGEILSLRAARMADMFQRRIVWVYWAIITAIAAAAMAGAVALTSIASGWLYALWMLEVALIGSARLMYVMQGRFAVRHDAAALVAGHSAATIRRALTPPPDLSGRPLKQWKYLVHRKARITALDRLGP
jgi:hypothetical protein